MYGNPRGSLQLITQEHLRRQPKEELGWRLPENESWEVRSPPFRSGSTSTPLLSHLTPLSGHKWLGGGALVHCFTGISTTIPCQCAMRSSNSLLRGDAQYK